MIKKIRLTSGLSVLFVSIIFLSLIRNVDITFAQGNGNSHTISSEFGMLGLGETNGEMLNVNSIIYQLPSETWNITHIELNFTDIGSKREIKDFETDFIGAKDLYKSRRGLAVEINIIEPTEIYGAHIYGYLSRAFTTTNISVQINGHDSITKRPNETIYGSTQLVMSNETKWHIHNFTSPIFLSPGNYFLILNGTEMLPQDNGRYYWFFTNNPKNPNLYNSEWDKDLGEWLNGTIGEPFLYKLDQKIIGQFYPEDINMTADIDGNYYPVLDGVNPGTGFLNESISLAPSNHNITIPLRINNSINLIFNLTYNFNLETQLISNGSGLINQESPIVWTLTAVIERLYDFQFIQFFYPKSWYNFTVFQEVGSNWENRTSEIDIDGNIITITNNTINNNDNWMITANSPNIDFNLNPPIFPESERGQDLQFSIPLVEGNFTFFITNPPPINYRFEVSIDKIDIIAGETYFSYLIPSNSRAGTYLLEIYWNNATDAGAQSQVFQVYIIPLPFDPIPIIIWVGLIAIMVSVIGIPSYIKIKKYRIRREEEEQKLFNKCMDVFNLDYIIVSDKKSGLNLYQQGFAGKQVDAAMISGFLQAIHSFGIELIKIEDQSQTIKLEYKDSIIIMTEFVNLRIILLMKESPSSNFLYSLEDLAYDIYKYYGKLIDEFSGDVKPFKSIEELLKHHLNTVLTYPLKLTKIEKLEKVRISQSDRSFINKAIDSMKQTGKDYFYLNSLIPEKECTPKDIETILNLLNRKIFQPME